MEKARNPILEPNKLVAILGYFFMTFIGSSLVITIILFLYCAINKDVSSEELFSAFTESDISKLDSTLYRPYAIVSSLGNMISYLLMFLLVTFYLRNFLKEDGQTLLQGYRKYLWLVPLSAGAFYGLSYLVDWLISLAVNDTSVNQSSIEIMIQNGGAVYMFIAVVLFAPLVEELIYRKVIFKLFDKKPIALAYIVSVFLFTIPHMLSTPFEDVGKWFLLCIPYACSGLLLCSIYHVSGKNVYVSWFAHMVNNLIAFILVFI